jgi:hypothetical protein
LVLAEVVVATPQQIIPAEEQSIAPRQEMPALSAGHDWLWGMQLPLPSWSTQHVLVLRLHSCEPHSCGPPSYGGGGATSMVASRPELVPELDPPEPEDDLPPLLPLVLPLPLLLPLLPLPLPPELPLLPLLDVVPEPEPDELDDEPSSPPAKPPPLLVPQAPTHSAGTKTRHAPNTYE